MRRTLHTALLTFLGFTLSGCGSTTTQPEFGELHPVKGVVKRAGQTVKGGVIQFDPDPPDPAFLINSEVGPDGVYSLSTVRTTDKSGERKAGAPTGKYRVIYTPSLGDQTAGGDINPVELPSFITVQPGQNDIPINLPRR